MKRSPKKLNDKEKLAVKILVRTVNEFLRRGLFTLDETSIPPAGTTIAFKMAEIPAIAAASDAGHGELSIRVASWPTELGLSAIDAAVLSSSGRRAMGGFYAHAWLERKTGSWLQTANGLSVSCANDKKAAVEQIPSEEPNGFLAEGRFFL